jgi:hypothetical protein
MRAGITTVIIPKLNEIDLADVPQEAKTKRPKRDRRTNALRDLRVAVNYRGLLLLVPVPDLQDLATAPN